MVAKAKVDRGPTGLNRAKSWVAGCFGVRCSFHRPLGIGGAADHFASCRLDVFQLTACLLPLGTDHLRSCPVDVFRLADDAHEVLTLKLLDGEKRLVTD
jgi:hypothetical protein